MDYLTEFPYYKSSKHILTCISRNAWRCFIRLCNMIQGWHCQGQISNLLAKQIIEQHGRCFTRTRYWLPFASTWVDPWWMGTCWVAHRFRFLCCVVFFGFICLHPLFCVSNVASVSKLFILDCLSVFTNVYFEHLCQRTRKIVAMYF
jgi:hypothetical protein